MVAGASPVPAIAMRIDVLRAVPRVVLSMAVLAAVGGAFSRFVPTTIACDPGSKAISFPHPPEVLTTLGLVAVVGLGFLLSVKLLDESPGRLPGCDPDSKARDLGLV